MTTPEERKKLGQQKSLKGLAVTGVGLVIALIAHFTPWTFMSGLLWVIAGITVIVGAIQIATAESGIKHLVALIGGGVLIWSFVSRTAGGADDFLLVVYLVGYGIVFACNKGAK